ncbi:MAG: PDZ domain-containing protein [Anaerolineae bacterium]|nr:PDZ domain-containing protein [Anaerolineae bacterium]
MLQKRTLIALLTTALALSGLSVLSASAANQAPRTGQAAQADAQAWLGVSVADSDDGVIVRMVVPGSPAEEVGLRRGDVIQAVDETAIETAAQLVEVIGSYAPGDEVTLTVAWRGEAREVVVALGEQPSVTDLVPETGPALRGALNLLGLDLEVTDEGLLVQAIAPDSPLADAGFAEGDVITAINGEPIDTDLPGMMMRLFRFDGDPLVFTVQRGGEEIEISIDPATVFGGAQGIMPMMPATRPSQLGVSFQTIDADLAAEQGLPVTEGALILEVYEDTPAAQAGLQVDDIIVAVEGDVVDARRTLPERLYAYDEGDVVTLTVLRGEEELAIEVTLGPSGVPLWGGMMLPGHPFEGWPEMWDHMRGWGGMGQGHNFDWKGQLEEFLDQHPFMEKHFRGRQNRGLGQGNLFDFQVPEIEVQPAVPGQSA